MDAIVLAGGYATRLWPITRNRPKMFLPIGESTVIDRILVDLESDDRIDRVFVSTNARFADSFRDYLATSEFEKPRVSVEETQNEVEKIGVVGALAQLIEREGINDDLLVVAGDNIISFSLSEFLDHFEADSSPTLAAYDVGSREQASDYGVVSIEEGLVTDFEEKPAEPDSSLVSIACYGFPAETLPQFSAYLSEDNNPDEPGWFLQWLVNRGAVRAFSFDGAWFDIGTPQSYLDAVEWELDGGTHIAPDATVENTTIGDTVHVMAGATIRDSEFERAVVFPDVTIESSTVENAIIDKQTTVSRTYLAEAQISAHSTITSPK